MKRKVLSLLLVFLSIFTLISCGKYAKVSFKTNMDSITLDTVKIEKGTEINLRDSKYVLTFEGYSFKGWYKDESLKQFAGSSLLIENNITLYAKWLQMFTVSFNSNGGTSIQSINVEDSSAIVLPNAPTRSGYVFEGWFKDEGLTQKFSESEAIKSNITLYAKWHEGHDVVFNSNGGSSVDSQYILDGGYATEPTSIVKEGYTFDKWYKDSELTLEFDFTQTKITSDITLYAKWINNTYHVEFNANTTDAIDGQMSSILLTYDVKSNIPSCGFERVGYTLSGWNTKADLSGDTFEDEEEVLNLTSTQNGIVTLYAIWVANEYTISFNSNGGEGVMENEDMIYDIPKALNPNSFTRDGFSFIGWSTNPQATIQTYRDSQEVSKLVSNGTITLYAVWKANTYAISFNSNGGDGVMDNVSYTYGTNVELPLNEFTRLGYTFIGWAKSSTGTVEYTNGAIINNPLGDITLYAVYDLVTYQITYNLNGGEGNTNPDTYNILSNEIVLNPITKYGYTFDGWYSENTFTNKVVKIESGSTGNISLFAKFTPNTYTITYKSNNGLNETDSSLFTYDAINTIKNCMFIYDEYTFVEWVVEGSSTKVNPGNYSLNDLYNDGNGVILVAQWSHNPVISFNTNGGSSIDSITEEAGSEINIPSNPTRLGYIFSGWYNDQELEAEYILTNIMPESSITLYAKWTPITYKVSFDANGGEGSMSDMNLTYDLGANLVENTFTKLGYRFIGWALSTTGDVSFLNQEEVLNLSSTNLDTVTLYAVWEALSIELTFNANGGLYSGNKESSVLTITYNEEASIITLTPLKTGYTFIGYALNSNDTTPLYTSGQVVSESDINAWVLEGSKTLYALWRANSYSFRFDSNGGVGTMDDQVFTYDVVDEINDSSFTKAGYHFIGWSLTPDGQNMITEGNNASANDGDVITLYAIWEANLYTIIFNGNGATSGEMTSPNYRYGQTYNLVANTFVKLHYTFVGWNTEADGSGTSYNDNASFSNLTTENNGEVTLYAQWKNTLVTLTVVATNSESQISTLVTYKVEEATTYIYDELTGEETNLGLTLKGYNPTLPGLTFMGLYTNIGATVKFNPTESYSIDTNTTLYAYFAVVLTFDLSSVGDDDIVVDLTKNLGVQTSYDAYEFVPSFTRIDNTVSVFETLDFANISESTTIRLLTFAKDQLKEDGITKYVVSNDILDTVTLDNGTVIKVYNLWTGTTPISALLNTTNTVLTSLGDEDVTVLDNKFTLTSKASGVGIFRSEDSESNITYYMFTANRTLSDFAITSSYREYSDNVSNGLTKFLNHDATDSPYLIGSANAFKLRFVLKDNAGATIYSVNHAKHYEIRIDSITLVQSYFINDNKNQFDGASIVYEYKYNDLTYCYIYKSQDDNDLVYDSIKFTENAVNSTVNIVITEAFPDPDTSAKSYTMIFKVNDGINVENNDELRVAYADTSITCINIHSTIVCELLPNQYYDYYDGNPAHHYPINLRAHYAIDYYNNYSNFGTIANGDVYSRAITDPNDVDNHLVINGNYFTIDGSKLPVVEVDLATGQGFNFAPSVGTNLIPGNNNANGDFIGTDGSITIDGVDYTGCWVKENQIAIFAQYLSAMDSVYDRYGAGRGSNPAQYSNSVDYKNLFIQSNTMTPVVNKNQEVSKVKSEVELACYNSGGYNGILIREGGVANLDNVSIEYANTGVYESFNDCKANLNYVRIDDSWANGIYLYASCELSLRNSAIYHSGGAAIQAEDVHPLSGTFAETFSNGKTFEIMHDPIVNIDTNTIISNWVVGNEIWFLLYGQNSVATLLSGLQDYMVGVSSADISNLNLNGCYSIEKARGYLDPSDYAELTEEGDALIAKRADVMFNFAILMRENSDRTMLKPGYQTYQVGNETRYYPGGRFGFNLTNGTSTINLYREPMGSDSTGYIKFAQAQMNYGYTSYIGLNQALVVYPVSSYSNLIDISVMGSDFAPYPAIKNLQAALAMSVQSQYNSALTGEYTWAEASAYADGINNFGIKGTPYGWAEGVFDGGSALGQLHLYTYYYSGYQLQYAG